MEDIISGRTCTRQLHFGKD